jgi:hypothetical protein
VAAREVASVYAAAAATATHAVCQAVKLAEHTSAASCSCAPVC